MSLTTKTFIEVPFSFYARHYWTNAPDQVSFLRHEHPHDFECTVWIEVKHDDRELEFYIVKEQLLEDVKLLNKFIEDNKRMCSCEHIADFIYGNLTVDYGTNRDYKIRVSEDGKYAAVKEYTFSS